MSANRLAMNPTLLELDQVGIHFGALKAVDGVDLKIAPGERCAILGPNGAGKTTLFNAITGMIPASCGRVALAGADITRMAPNVRASHGIARTFQITNLFFGLTVEDNLLLAVRGCGRAKFSLFGAGRAREDERQLVADALEKCHLHQRRSLLVKELSYGEQRQLELRCRSPARRNCCCWMSRPRACRPRSAWRWARCSAACPEPCQ
jgi:branched-chain amino acid transport system ATP-binding protein